jgi:glycine/D-amino acid oxidase-like deaminating enzyme
LTRREGIDASISKHPSVYLAGSILDARGLATEARARERLGLPSQYLNRRELRTRFDLSRSAAIVSAGSVAADPRALCSGFLRRAQQLGARLFAPHEVVDIKCGKRSVLTATKDGFTIESRQIVFCTGYELPKIVPTHGHSIASTWVIATKRQAKHLWPSDCFIWEAKDPYLYVRATRDGRIICGGEDEEFADEASRDGKLDSKKRTLEKKARETAAEDRLARPIRLDSLVRSEQKRPAQHRSNSGLLPLLCRVGLWRERNYVFDAGRATHFGFNWKTEGSGCTALCLSLIMTQTNLVDCIPGSDF